MERNKAQMVFTDPPYNVPNAGHVTKREGCGEFAMGAGEMSPGRGFHVVPGDRVRQRAVTWMQAGAVGFFCMDWRHLRELWVAVDTCIR